jgi:hypothetical protein
MVEAQSICKHRIRNASKGITLALCFDVVDLISIGVDLGHGLRLYRAEATPERENNTFNSNASMCNQA